jgi:hypothetical protein
MIAAALVNASQAELGRRIVCYPSGHSLNKGNCQPLYRHITKSTAANIAFIHIFCQYL